MNLKQIVTLGLVLSAFFFVSCGQVADSKNSDSTSVKEKSEGKKWAKKMTKTVMSLWKDPKITGEASFPGWSYDEGVILKGVEGLWKLTGDGDYFSYMQHSMDYFVDEEGHIKTYDSSSYKLDDINTGKVLLTLYRVTGKKKYWKAATRLRDQLKTQPRVKEGGFWHKKIYTHQMWLDGLYMAEPFYAEYAMLNHEGDKSFKDIAHQFTLMEKHSRDPKTGLLYHGWDASHEQRWADSKTGMSSHFWDRAIGWYAMALVDALDYFPENSEYRKPLVDILDRLAVAITKYQDPKSGCWWQVMDKGDSTGNFLEASGSSMFVYALAKGVRKGYLPDKYMKVATKGFQGILNEFVVTDEKGQVNLKGTCPVAGLGGDPYRDGSYEYYIKQKPVENDPKGMGAFILAADEMAIADLQQEGKGHTVTLDHYFNNEHKKDITGKEIPFHYVWTDRENSGFSFWKNIFNFRGVKTNELAEAPNTENLKKSDIYIIVDPDTKKETDQPNYMTKADITAITDWVKKGGVLVLMENDSGNAEFEHFNQLAKEIGFQFNEDSKNRVQAHQYEQGAIAVSADNPIFKNVDTVYLKEVSTIKSDNKAQKILKLKSGETVAITISLGEGKVFAVGDPWFYNEYVDGRKLPAKYQNYQAATDLTDWLIQQVKK